MVHEKPWHPQSQGSVERTNADIKDMLTALLPTSKPPTGLWFKIRPISYKSRKCKCFDSQLKCNSRCHFSNCHACYNRTYNKCHFYHSFWIMHVFTNKYVLKINEFQESSHFYMGIFS